LGRESSTLNDFPVARMPAVTSRSRDDSTKGFSGWRSLIASSPPWRCDWCQPPSARAAAGRLAPANTRPLRCRGSCQAGAAGPLITALPPNSGASCRAPCSVPARGSQGWIRARQLPLQQRQHQPAHRRLPQSDGADCAIGAQQQGELEGRAPCGLVLGVLLAGRSECGAARGVAAVVLAAAWIASVISLQSGSPPLSCRKSVHIGCPRSASPSRSSRTKPSSALLWERKSWSIGGSAGVGQG
jgi:hypothetical protein